MNMVEPVAHSAKQSVPIQSYRSHIEGVLKVCEKILLDIKPFMSEIDWYKLAVVVVKAALCHDMGKLCDYNQSILLGKSKGELVNHVDAGSKYLASTGRMDDWLAHWLVHSHHWGLYEPLPAIPFSLRDAGSIGDRCPKLHRFNTTENYVDENFEAIKARHDKALEGLALFIELPADDVFDGKEESALFMRMALSILVDADHTDTARNYGNHEKESVALKPAERLGKLDKAVQSLSKEKHDPLKDAVYESCRNSSGVVVGCCASEVGTGKTTAIMAYGLNQAAKHGLGKIIYIAPYTSIISQTVDNYRNFLTLPGENSVEIVSEHHHQVDFYELVGKFYPKSADHQSQHDDSIISQLRKLVYDWRSPIVCTTAVQAIESLGSYKTSKLLKLHNYIGSCVLMDEFHNCLPNALLSMMMKWAKELSDRFGCRILLASGTMIKPWEHREVQQLSGVRLNVENIVDPEISNQTLEREKGRVPIHYDFKRHGLDSICDFIEQDRFQGSKVIVCNTINNAALIANYLGLRGVDVLHISTALTPEDREKVLTTVGNKLRSGGNWALVGTSCIEMGLDLSFQWGFRENANLMSTFQLAGRVRRKFENYSDYGVFAFELDSGKNKVFTFNEEFRETRRTAARVLARGAGPEDCAEAFARDLINLSQMQVEARYSSDTLALEKVMKLEADLELKELSDYCNVVTGDKQTVIIHEDRISDKCSSIEVVKNSVQIYEARLKNLPVRPSSRFPGFLVWDGEYGFLGWFQEQLKANGWVAYKTR